MLKVIIAIIIILGGISTILLVMDEYKIAGFKIKNKTLELIVCLCYIVLGLYIFFTDIIDFFTIIKSI